MSQMPRVQEVVLPILRGHDDLSDSLCLGPLADGRLGLNVVSWVPNVEHRTFPMLQVRRLGGLYHATRPRQLQLPVIELTAYTQAPYGSLSETEELYQDAYLALFDAVRNQTQTPYGYLHSIRETMGATQFSSLFQDSWRVQGLIQLGLRPPRTN